ncbi:uncharacterized protein LOC132564693 [Ylistrum balloti]|uniref:uncharacterized protein LOC132564693 n=1 Tax=Ylistrum balloti TaxID=509963 RepID=UPI0029059C6A|nr:uncharacterized protein LOC132564693 [Ylistrum balloti]
MQNFVKIQSRKEKKGELRDAIMADMRKFANLFLNFKSLAQQKKCKITSTVEMLNRNHFMFLRDALDNITTKEDGSIKTGLKVSLGFLLKRSANVLKGHYLVQKADDKAKEVENFLTVLSYFWNSIFSDAQYANVKARQTDLRKPKHLPIEEDIQKLRSFMIEEQNRILDPYVLISNQEYIILRDILVSRLTLFNARRGGEPSRLLLKEWKDAENGVWIGDSAVQAIDDPIEKRMLGNFRIAYQSGKNINQMVPILIPNDCLEGLRKLACSEIRKAAGVRADNIFLFPLTQNSAHHVKGWHAVESVCKKADILSHINATSMRHRASTIYAALDIPENERRLFYQHMGHSEDINKNVYQCPLAIQEVTKVGKFFENLDKRLYHTFDVSKCSLTEMESANEMTTVQPTETQGPLDDSCVPGPSTVTSDPLRKRKAANKVTVIASPKKQKTNGRRTLNLAKHQECLEMDQSRSCSNDLDWEMSDYDSAADKDYTPSNSDITTDDEGDSDNISDTEDNCTYDTARKDRQKRKVKVYSFIKEHPNVLADINPERKVLLIRTKIYNERNKLRSIVNTQLNQMKK